MRDKDRRPIRPAFPAVVIDPNGDIELRWPFGRSHTLSEGEAELLRDRLSAVLSGLNETGFYATGDILDGEVAAPQDSLRVPIVTREVKPSDISFEIEYAVVQRVRGMENRWRLIQGRLPRSAWPPR